MECTGERRRACKVLVGIPEGRRQLGRHWHRWKIILKWVLKKLDRVYGLDYSDSE